MDDWDSRQSGFRKEIRKAPDLRHCVEMDEVALAESEGMCSSTDIMWISLWLHEE